MQLKSHHYFEFMHGNIANFWLSVWLRQRKKNRVRWMLTHLLCTVFSLLMSCTKFTFFGLMTPYWRLCCYCWSLCLSLCECMFDVDSCAHVGWQHCHCLQIQTVTSFVFRFFFSTVFWWYTIFDGMLLGICQIKFVTRWFYIWIL